MKVGVIYTIFVISAFLLGGISGLLISSATNVEQPLAGNAVLERDSPSDFIKEDQISVYEDKVIIDAKDVEWAKFTNTNSMDPLFDEYSNALEIVPKSIEEIHVGDIVSYKSEITGTVIVHRIVSIGTDDKGWFAIFKGDNINSVDPEKVRFNQVQRVVVAIIY